MSHVVTQDNLFKPRLSRTEAKADLTTHAARVILDAEAEQRDAKTAKLRQARLQMEATRTTSKTPVKPRPVNAMVRRARSSM